VKSRSLERLQVSPWKLVGIAVVASISAGLAARLATGDVLGRASVGFEVAISGLVFYITVSTPGRLAVAARLAQAREAVLLSALAGACVGITGSKVKTFFVLESNESEVEAALRRIRQRILLGAAVGAAAREGARGLVSDSVADALKHVAALSFDSPEDRGEETEGLAESDQLSHETKLPILMTACFFTPILLLLYALFSGTTTALGLTELIALQVLVLDLVYYLSGTGGRGAH
jgi:hypothetical protein